MKIIVVGGGGREHTIIKKLKENPAVEEIFALPGNGGIAADATCVNIGAKDIDGIVAFAKEKAVDYVVVAPDDPLVLGCVDPLEAAGFPCFGPRKNAAIIEGSKVFSKDLMKKYNIPTAAYEVFSDPEEALRYLETAPIPTVVKADGLCLGKGVTVAMTREEAIGAVREIMEDKKFGQSGDRIVIEEYLEGPEVSVLSFTDGTTVVPMVSSTDHKRAGDGDTGPNTGGMGLPADDPGDEGGRPGIPGLPLLRPDGHEGRAEGHRIQLPLRRSGDAGGTAPAGERSADGDAGVHKRNAGGLRSKVPRRERMLRRAGLEGIPRILRKGI